MPFPAKGSPVIPSFRTGYPCWQALQNIHNRNMLAWKYIGFPGARANFRIVYGAGAFVANFLPTIILLLIAYIYFSSPNSRRWRACRVIA